MSQSRRIEVYVSAGQDHNSDLVAKHKLEFQDTMAEETFGFELQDIKLLVEIDLITGKTKILECNGEAVR